MKLESLSKMKSERFELRLTPEQKDIIEQAAAIRGLSSASFILSYVLGDAQQVIEEDRTTTLSKRDFRKFQEILEAECGVSVELEKAELTYDEVIQHSEGL